MGQAVKAADELLRSTGEVKSGERAVTRKGRVDPAFQGRQGSEGPSEVKIIALGRWRGEEGGAQLKHEISGFTNGSKVKKADFERLL